MFKPFTRENPAQIWTHIYGTFGGCLKCNKSWPTLCQEAFDKGATLFGGLLSPAISCNGANAKIIDEYNPCNATDKEFNLKNLLA